MSRAIAIALSLGAVGCGAGPRYERDLQLRLGAIAKFGRGGPKDLVRSCGDGLCDAVGGESADNCPADCRGGCVRSYNQQTICSGVQRVVEPQSPDEALHEVAKAVAAGLPVRAVGRAHSANESICNRGVVVSTTHLTGWPKLDDVGGVPTVRVLAGVRLGELNYWLDRQGYSLGYAVPEFRDATIAGAIATGTHGSSPTESVLLSERVERVRAVVIERGAEGMPQAVIQDFSRVDGTSDDEMKAWRANIGLLGIVVEVWLRVSPRFNLEVRADKRDEDGLFVGDGPFDLLRGCSWGQLNWFPGRRKLVRTCGKPAARDAEPELAADNTLLDPPIPTSLSGMFKSALQAGARSTFMNCALESIRYDFYFQPPIRSARGVSDRVVGPSFWMMSSALTSAQQGLFEEDWEIAVPRKNAVAALRAARDIFRRNDTCFPLIGVFLRFARVTDATWIAHASAGGDFAAGDSLMYFEMVFYAPVGLPASESERYRKPLVEVATQLIGKYGGRPHWGKCRGDLFQKEREARGGAGNYGENWTRFVDVLTARGSAIFTSDLATQLSLIPKPTP